MAAAKITEIVLRKYPGGKLLILGWRSCFKNSRTFRPVRPQTPIKTNYSLNGDRTKNSSPVRRVGTLWVKLLP